MTGVEKSAEDRLSQYAPKYRVLANRLRGQIQQGGYRPNEMFLSESQLIAEYKVSRATIRAALEVLVREKLLEKRQGRGTFIAANADKVYETTLVFSYPDASSLRHPYVGGLYYSFESEVSKWAQENQRDISVKAARNALHLRALARRLVHGEQSVLRAAPISDRRFGSGP